MPKKKFTPDMESGFVGDNPTKKSAPKPYIESPFITKLRYDRDSCLLADLFVCEETKNAILERRR